MKLQNGYKVIYEKAIDGKRTFYASKSNVYPTADDIELASFNDADYVGKVIYEHAGKFYVSKGSLPKFNENGDPTDTVIEGFEEILNNTTANRPTTMPNQPQQPAYTEAISTNGDSYGKLAIEGNVVTLKATGTVKWLKSSWGTFGNWVGFRITLPEGVDATKAIYTRPNGTSCSLGEVLDPGKDYASVYSDMSKYGDAATYHLDWDGNGVNDLTVIIDVTEATLEGASEEIVAE